MIIPVVATLLVAVAPAAADDDVAALAAEVRDAVKGANAGRWAAHHRHDSVQPFAFTRQNVRHDTEQWCVRAIRGGSLASGARWKRTAYFFHPPPPPDLRVPSGSVADVTRDCVLGLAWIEAPAGARTLLQRAVTAVLGEGSPVTDPLRITGFGSAYWSEVEEWLGAGGLRATAARNGDRAFVRLAFPAWDMADQWFGGEGPERAALQERVRGLAAQVRAARHIDKRVRARLASLLEDHDYWELGLLPRDEVAAAFEGWLASVRALPPAARIDTLLVADRVMEFIGRHASPDAPGALHVRARFAGAEFAWAPIGGGWVYAHNFARDALSVAPAGRPRDLALLRLMELGFDYTGTCDAGEDEWERVIATGEPLVRRSRDPRILASAHLMVADAYATIVDLASGPPWTIHLDADDDADAETGAGAEPAPAPPRYAQREADARVRALAHYRAAFAIDRASEAARRAWRAASRLAAGSPPGVLRYYCIYD